VRTTAPIEGPDWSAKARGWAELWAGLAQPARAAVADATGIADGTRLLDIGCGSGEMCQLAAARGASVAGLDAAESAVAIARERLPGGDLRVGEIEELPYEGASFDVVTGLNAFQYAANPVRALGEARRVVRAGGAVVIATWGTPERCEAAAYLRALGSFLPPPPPGAPGPFALSTPGALEELAGRAGLAARQADEVTCVWEYPDRPTALRGLLAAGPAVRAVRAAGEEAVGGAVAAAIAPFRNAQGGYRIENAFRFLIASPERAA
jgi:SAM-dependent methyltransferase